jgi:hypothetical protein
MQKMFRINRKVPTTKDEMFKLYISLLKHITTNDIIKTTQNSTLTNKKRGYTYKLNKELLLYHIELNKYSNEDLINYDVNLLKMLDIEKPKLTYKFKNGNFETNIKDDPFIDSDNESDNDVEDRYEHKYVRHDDNVNKNRSYLDFGLREDDDVKTTHI